MAEPGRVVAEPGPGAAPHWARLHPLTPLLRGGRFAVLVVVVLQQGLAARSARAAALVLAVGVPVVAAAAYVSWRATRYRVTDSELQVDSGVLTRRQRRVPLARLQSVDVVRPLLGRVLGLAELRLEVAGGGSTEAPLAYLAEHDARRVRALLLLRAADPRTGPEAPPELRLVQVPAGPLLGSALLGGPVWAVLGVLAVAVGTALVDVRLLPALLLGAVPLGLGVATATARRVLGEYGFTVSESPAGLRLRHGLLATRSATIPPGRVQGVRVREPLLWRPFGWVRVEVDVAGYSRDGEEQLTTSALLPVAPRGLAGALVARVLGSELPVPVAPAPGRARWLAPAQQPRLRLGLDDRHLVSAAGLLSPVLDVVPLAKVQSLRLRAGPWQRRLRLADLHVDTAGRRLPGAVGRHRDAREAADLLLELGARARAARVRSPG